MKYFFALLLLSLNIHAAACVQSPRVNNKIKYIEPCVTDKCIETYLKKENQYCLATIEINGNTDWAYIFGKKCNQLVPNKIYEVTTEKNRCYRHMLPRWVYTESYRPEITNEQLNLLKFFMK